MRFKRWVNEEETENFSMKVFLKEVMNVFVEQIIKIDMQNQIHYTR